VAELQHVSQQDYAVDPVQGGEQGSAELGPPQDVGALTRAEMEV
jgi:hypothetical protein